jgi:hypothetical protein
MSVAIKIYVHQPREVGQLLKTRFFWQHGLSLREIPLNPTSSHFFLSSYTTTFPQTPLIYPGHSIHTFTMGFTDFVSETGLHG